MFNRKIEKRKRQFVNSIIYIVKSEDFMLKCPSGKSLGNLKKGKQKSFCTD